MQAIVNRCPSADLLDLLLTEELSGPEREVVETHVESCPSCQKQLELMVPTTVVAAAPAQAIYDFQPEPAEEFLRRLRNLPRPPLHICPPGLEPPVAVTVDRYERRRLGPYEVLEKIGMGNMGVVYKAEHTELGKVVALKVLPMAKIDELSVARFKNEARAAGRLDHPNVVAIHDAGQVDGVHYLVMGFVEGADLARLLQRHGPLSIPDACDAVRQAAAGLQHAFERGLVHRDIKPSNLMLARGGVVKVLDLGIARSFGDAPVSERLTATGMLLGTADYLAPEQWENPHAVDTRADVYSLGCTLYHLLAGHAPFGPKYESILTKMRAHLEAPVPPIGNIRPDVPAGLATALERMLAKNPADRFSTPGEVVEAMQPFIAGSDLATLLDRHANIAGFAPTEIRIPLAADTAQPALTRHGNPTSRRSTPRNRWARRVTVALVAGLCIVLATVGALRPWHPRPPLPTAPVKIEALTVNQYRGQDAMPLGNAIASDQPVRVDDSVRVSAKFSAPAHFYLIAFNPDGTEQLCYPEDPGLTAVYYPEHKDRAKAMGTAPPKSAELRFPREQYFEPGVAGLQVFVLVSSTEPLPPYATWRSGVDAIPWRKTEKYDPQARWQFDGSEFSRFPNVRGERVERCAGGISGVVQVLQARGEFQAVQAVAFPVTKE